MFSVSGCTVTLPFGAPLRRQRVVVEGDVFRSFDKRTGKLMFESAVTDFVQVSTKRWEAQSPDGKIAVTKSGCGCGR